MLYTLSRTDTISQAIRLFRRSNQASLPILDESNRLLGVLYLKDIADKRTDLSVVSYLSSDYASVNRTLSDNEIIQLFAERSDRIREIYLTDFDHKLTGMILLPYLLKLKVAGGNIDEKEQFLQQILRQNSLARCILDGLNDGVIIVDHKSCVLYCNPSYGRILGLNHTKVVNKLLEKIEPNSKIMGVIETGLPLLNKSIEIKSLGLMVVASITPISFKGRVVGAISVFSDITEMLNVASELEKSCLIKELLLQEMAEEKPLPPAFNAIIGSSKKLRKQLDLAVKVASVDSPVMILGESGTGKELVAKAIHEHSHRHSNPFVSVNCSAIPEHLLESELFGYEDGAFTGARKGGKKGKVELAAGGTLFLDEIGDMPLAMQIKLLRFLQEKEFERIGGAGVIHADVRIISATNKDINAMVRQKTFREDLLYRINVFTICLPPLRERKIDILQLVEYFKCSFQEKCGKQLEFSQECLRFFSEHYWPGNVRQLKNVIEHAVIMADQSVVTVENLPNNLCLAGNDYREEKSPPNCNKLCTKVQALERKAILDALESCGYNKTQAMTMLGISRRTFYKKLKEMDI